MITTIETHSAEETRNYAARLALAARRGDVFALTGGLGAGKTCFAAGFAAGLGFTGRVTSPTFGLIHEYAGGRLPLYHFDAYRIADAAELEDAGAEDYLYGGGVCIVEWAELAERLLPAGAVRVAFETDAAKGGDWRRITIDGGTIDNDGRDDASG